jgi:hypothetical protein
MIDFEQQLAMGARMNFGGTEPLQDFPERRGARQHVELEGKNVGAIHPGLVDPAVLALVTM